MSRILREAGRRPNDSLVVHFLTLRKAVGAIGMVLPFVLVIGENLRDLFARHAVPRVDREIIEVSISAYFHTGMRDVFVGSLCAIAIFLICYQGYQRIDNVVANVAGVTALLVALVPTSEQSREAPEAGSLIRDSMTLFSGPYAPDPILVGRIHFGSAAMFLVLLAAMSLFLFTRSDPAAAPNPWKEQRNFIYRLCGVLMLLCVAAIAVAKLLLSEATQGSTSYVFWLEVVAVVAFGVSWITKGEGFRKDQPQPPRFRPVWAIRTRVTSEYRIWSTRQRSDSNGHRFARM